MTAGPILTREFGRQAFGADPAGYHKVRPGYPEWIYDTLAAQCGLRPGAAVFEIGPGTGKATRRLLDVGARPLVAVEADPRLADFLRADNPDAALEVVVAPFEEADMTEASFDLGICATAFHWLDEDVALAKIARLLRPGGWWAAFWNVYADDTQPDAFHEATGNLLGPPANPSAGTGRISFGLDAEARLAAIGRTGAFDTTDHHLLRWTLLLNAEDTVALYATYSNVVARPDREAILAEIGRVARDVFKDRVIRHMTTSLYIARRAG